MHKTCAPKRGYNAAHGQENVISLSEGIINLYIDVKVPASSHSRQNFFALTLTHLEIFPTVCAEAVKLP